MTDEKYAVPAAFDAGASAYDGLVDANPGYHRHLRMSADRMRLVNGGKGLRLLDAGCGTGASTAALLSVAPEAEVIAVDASSGMLAEAAAKRWPATVRFVHSRIEDIATAGVEARSTASSRRTCCATCPTRTRNCASSVRFCGPARRSRCTSTRFATRGARR